MDFRLNKHLALHNLLIAFKFNSMSFMIFVEDIKVIISIRDLILLESDLILSNLIQLAEQHAPHCGMREVRGVQGYLARKKQPPPPSTTIGP